MYAVRIKDSAVSCNEAVAELVAAEGTRHTFDSKRAAEAFATARSERGGRVRIQAVAPQDPEDVDGYLVSHPRRHVASPKDAPGPGHTFDVGANAYGAIGQALVCGRYGLSPGVRWYVDRHVDAYDPDRHRLVCESDPTVGLPAGVRWTPDVLIAVRDGRTTVVRAYCEIKTGNGTCERSQREDMRTVARSALVLQIRVTIDSLPDEYTIRVREVDP